MAQWVKHLHEDLSFQKCTQSQMHTAGCISSTLVGKWVAEPREAWELTHTECTQAANRRKKLTLWLQDKRNQAGNDRGASSPRLANLHGAGRHCGRLLGSSH